MIVQGIIISLAALVFALIALILGKIITFVLFLLKKGTEGKDTVDIQVEDEENNNS